ncbi:PdxA family protein [Prevotella sp. KH2C16]|uniref:PdxA family dehydrogenase n=1 Tax=Prevotella sp. KH2C16 TaxID=1855325 RepID=UPI0008EA644C|nr:4-hydroxythreonine-4-phosphate dehydrogenase PdxA [Prevotella sp. KH2C16]SFG63083.1 4-hydroxythreonine-4-phosphate dehydrogenase [Prevotella sp. KH2C16]
MEQRKIRVAITHGDTNGVGYELIFKTFSDPTMLELCTPIIYGSPKVAAYHRNALGIEASFSIIERAEEAREGRVNMLTACDEEVKVEIGSASQEAGHASLMALDRAITDYRDGLFDVLVTCPVNDASIQGAGFQFKGQTAYIEECFNDDTHPMTILQNEQLRMGILTEDMPLKEVAAAITKENVVGKIKTFATCLKRDYSISCPRVAVLSLNPGAGKEEDEVIRKAIGEFNEESLCAFGPYAADDFFANGDYRNFDGVLAMYHDQGMAPFAALTIESSEQLLTGLPIVCTAPNQGVQYSLAGKDAANENSLRHAIFLAIDVFRNRECYDEPMAHPLPKLYRERRDESEKVRFAIPKKHENAIKERAEKPQGARDGKPRETAAE